MKIPFSLYWHWKFASYTLYQFTSLSQLVTVRKKEALRTTAVFYVAVAVAVQ